MFDIEVERTHNFIANGLAVSNTRWHQDDLIGRLREQAKQGGEQWDSLTLQAIYDDPTLPDPMGRELGEALWPERFDKDALIQLRNTLPGHWWEALYQQRPTPPGGALAKASWFPIVQALPAMTTRIRRVRFWDCAGTEEVRGRDPDWTVGCRMARYPDGRFFIEDVIRFRGTAAEVDKRIVQTAIADGSEVAIREEEEPGSSGKAIIAMRKKSLAGFNYLGQKPLGKPDGWTPMLIQAEVGNVLLFKGPASSEWHGAFINEVIVVPHGAHDDQMDAAAGGFHYLTIGSHLAAADILAIGSLDDEKRSAFPRMQF